MAASCDTSTFLARSVRGNVLWVPSGRGLLVEVGGDGAFVPAGTRLLALGAARSHDLPISPPWVFTPDGNSVLGSVFSELAITDLATGQVQRRFADASASFAPYAFSPDGRLLATAGEDSNWHGPSTSDADPVPTEAAYAHASKIKVWRVADGRRLRMVDGVFGYNENRLAFLDRHRLAIPTQAQVLNVSTGRVTQGRSVDGLPGLLWLPPLPARPFQERPVAFPGAPVLGERIAPSPDGMFLVVPEFSPDTLRGDTRLLVWDLPNRRLLRRIAVPEVRNLRSISFVAKDRLRLKGPDPRPFDIVLAPDGRALSRRVVQEPADPGLFRLYPAPVRSLDGRRVLWATPHGLEFRDATTDALLTSVPEFEREGENGLAAVPSGFAVARRSRDLRLFDDQGRLTATLVAFPGSGWAAWEPTDKAWGSFDGLPHLRRLVGDRLIPIVPERRLRISVPTP